MTPIYNQEGIALYLGDVIECLRALPDDSVHMCVTSPPYYNVRDYGYDGQLGLEATPQEYVRGMIRAFQEVKRVLRPEGTLWLICGDKYASSGGHKSPGQTAQCYNTKHGLAMNGPEKPPAGLKAKDLIGIPWLVAFGLQDDGWWLRSDIIWQKPNCMPDSCLDRPARSHEYIFLMSKNGLYFYDGEAVKGPAEWGQPNSPESIKSPMGQGYTRRAKAGGPGPHNGKKGNYKQDGYGRRHAGFNERYKENYAGQKRVLEDGAFRKANNMGKGPADLDMRNCRDVWTIATQPRPESHFAAFPDELPRRCILAGTSEVGCCPECGAPWRRKTKRERTRDGDPVEGNWSGSHMDGHKVGAQGDGHWRYKTRVRTLGWLPTCECGHGQDDAVPCTVLDPFVGRGTTCLQAHKLGRHSIGIDMSEEYMRDYAIPNVERTTAQGRLF